MQCLRVKKGESTEETISTLCRIAREVKFYIVATDEVLCSTPGVGGDTPSPKDW